MKHLYLYALSIVAGAEPTTVIVSGPVYTPSGVAANGGTVTATLAAPCSVGSTYIHRGSFVATLDANGSSVRGAAVLRHFICLSVRVVRQHSPHRAHVILILH